MAKNFGRDEMNALLGGDSAFRDPVMMGKKNKATTRKADVADMTVQETAAFLQQQQLQKKVPPPKGAQRHRTGKVREYQKLLAEQPLPNQAGNHDASSVDEEESEQEQRAKAAPVLVARRRRRRDSSSSDDSSTPPRRRPIEDDSSSSDEDEDDQRRQRILQLRRQKPTMAEQRGDAPSSEDEELSETRPVSVQTKPSVPKSTKSSSSEDEESSEKESSSDEESSSEDDSIPKPVFIPKNKRGVVKTYNEEETPIDPEEEKQRIKERKRQARAKVQEVLATQEVAPTEEAFEGITGVRNPPPDDKDTPDSYDAWEVRELQRLLSDYEAAMAREKEQRDLERRRNMTDEERLAEDIASGRYQKPGEQKSAGEKGHTKRYFHKGAFYMDEEEWDEKDVRHKSAEYASAATGDESVNRAALPKVMQVKKFGFANQSKYKGLAAEDTTDKGSNMLPLVHGQKRKTKDR